MEASFGTEDEAALQGIADTIAPIDDGLAQQARSRGLLARASNSRQSASFDCAVNALRGWTAVAGDSDARVKHDEVRAAVVNDLAAAVAKADLDDADLETRTTLIRSALAVANLYEAFVDEPAPRSAATLRALLTTTEASLAREQAKKELPSASWRPPPRRSVWRTRSERPPPSGVGGRRRPPSRPIAGAASTARRASRAETPASRATRRVTRVRGAHVRGSAA